MQRFLETCASYIHQKYGPDLTRICIVLPNRRSGVFLTAYLRKLIDRPVIGPAITTVNEWMLSFSALLPAARLKLLAGLYDAFSEETGTAESFDDFYFWGEVLLADFDDIDKYRIPAEELFRNLSQMKELDHQFDYLTDAQKQILLQFWGSLRSYDLYRQEKDFITFWERLPGVYRKFRRKLTEGGLGYPGMIMRDGLEQVLKGKFPLRHDHYVIAGLNALNGCEKELFVKLRDMGKADFLWDYDDFYVGNPLNGAGKFIRENLGLFPPPEDFHLPKVMFVKPKTIELVAVASGVGQAQVIPSFFGEMATPVFDQAAVVLADESLLFPVLGAIPESLGKVNITMGYPVRDSPVVSLLMQIASLVTHSRQKEQSAPRFYYRQVTGILSHPLMSAVEPEKVRALLEEIKSKNKIYLDPEELNFSPLHRQIFNPPQQVREFGGYLLEILRLLYLLTVESPDRLIVREMIWHIYSALEKLNTVVEEILAPGNREISPAVFFNLMNRHLNTESVSFEGEPLSGLQVMGILETRCLDFDHLVIIGLNEDNWPRGSNLPSLIPHNLRKGFGLPGIDDQEAMYAYYFYRLLQRATRITATWNTVRAGTSGGELSRFGFQLMLHSPHLVTQRTFDFPFFSNPPKPVLKSSSGEISRQLLAANNLEKPLSPSAIITYLMCSLRFYFRYVAGLKEADEVAEEIDRQLFGNIFHKAVENLYQPQVGRLLTDRDFETLAADAPFIRKSILQALATEFFMLPATEWENLALEGKTLLIFTTVEAYIRNVLKLDREMAPLHLIALESSFEATLPVEVDGTTKMVRIGGKVDRVDQVGGLMRVIDYKTGSLDDAALSFSSVDVLFDRSVKKPKKEVLQALTYAWILKKGYYGDSSIIPVIYAILKLNDERFRFTVRMNNEDAEISRVEKVLEDGLATLLGEIFSAKTQFNQTPFTDRCGYCPYAGICRRE